MNIILTLNAGSSSVKFSVYATDDGQLQCIASGQVEGLGATPRFKFKTSEGDSAQLALDATTTDASAAISVILAWLQTRHGDKVLAAVGHRVVHGGVDLDQPVVISADTMSTLEKLIPLAPLHQPHNLAGIQTIQAVYGHVPQVACFDTSFHRTHPWVADTFALPQSYYEEGVRRYGFHGLSYEFIARQLQQVAPAHAQGRVIVAHLGNGASACAMKNGRSVASTMGFTALDGLPMGTRCGQLDPGVVLYLMQEKGMDASAITQLLYKDSGLKGLSNLSHDMRELEGAHTESARGAIAYFVDRIRREIGALASTISGLDALVLTGGIGENAASFRQQLLEDMGWLGVTIDPAANLAHAQVISTAASKVCVYVLKTDEERMIAEHTARLVGLI